jgi:UDP-MurNAc hydroxylase
MSASKITFLSHASYIFETPDVSILVDPWLVGSCYWRSWWNYPPVREELIGSLKPDAIYITHFHWDHWHGPSLKKLFPKDTLIITHDEPNTRSVRDLRSMGFKNLRLLRHGETFRLKGVEMTVYQFGLFLNDSAIIMEAKDLVLLNANDCKIAGASLKYMLGRHRRIDIALRSHSSANDRVCYTIKDNDEFHNDDPSHYTTSFKYFMDAVKPRYAVPFASNHCYLHRDVLKFNEMINDPYKLECQLHETEKIGGWELKIALSGDIYTPNTGFLIDCRNREYFENKQKHIAEYSDANREKLEKYYNFELTTSITPKILQKFEAQIRSIPWWSRWRFRNWKYQVILTLSVNEIFLIVDPWKCSVIQVDQLSEKLSKIFIPTKIFVDSVLLNMFHHGSISKRNSYIFNDIENLQLFEKFQSELEKVELGVYPISVVYALKLLCAYVRRRHELVVYFKALMLRFRGMPMYKIEEEILKEG